MLYAEDMLKLFSPALLIFSLLMFCSQPGRAQSGAAAVAPTEISAGLGVCSALINVTGADAKPIYKAKVTTRIHYGLMGVKKLDLETYTSVGGQVKILQLPEARWVGTGLAADAACARPPSQNPPSGFPATGSPGCTHGMAVIP